MSAPDCPECAVGKHGNCDDMSWDPDIDAPAVCPCFVREHLPAPPAHDHERVCCTEHGTHSMPHVGCILR